MAVTFAMKIDRMGTFTNEKSADFYILEFSMF